MRDAGCGISDFRISNFQHPASNIKHQVSNGFTLLELLISLTIIAVIVVIISGAMRIGIRAWEKGEADIDVRQRYRVVLSLMKRQLGSACLREMNENAKSRFVFKGDDTSLTFSSYVPLLPDNKFGIVHVRYVVQEQEGGERLLFYERNLVLTGEDADISEPDDNDLYELIPDAQHISFEYMKKGEEGPEWQPLWEPENDKGFPLAVRIIFNKHGESDPIHVIARLR